MTATTPCPNCGADFDHCPHWTCRNCPNVDVLNADGLCGECVWSERMLARTRPCDWGAIQDERRNIPVDDGSYHAGGGFFRTHQEPRARYRGL